MPRAASFGFRKVLIVGVAVLVGGPTLAQPKVGQTPPVAAAQPSTADACYAGYGLNPAQKIKICSDVIDSGSVKGLGLGLAYFNRGQALSNAGDQKGAMADYRMALRYYTEVIRNAAPSAQLVFQRGLIYHVMGDTDQAIVDYSDAIRIAPNETFAYVNRGIVLYTKKDNNEGAIADFNMALKLNKCEVNAWINRGLVYKRKGDLNQSIADLTSAIACLPGNPAPLTSTSLDPGKPMSAAYFQIVTQTTQLADAYYQRGLVYLDKAGKERGAALPLLDKAMADFNMAIRINPTAAAHFVGRASTHMYKEEFQPAIEDFTEAIRLSPGDEYTFLHRGIAYHSVNEPDNAIADYTEAHRINPKDVAPLINRGIIYYSKKGQYDLAIADFTEALKIDPKEINALINRGICVAREGRSRQSHHRFQRGAETGHADRGRAEVRLEGPRGGAPLGAGRPCALPARHGLCRQDRVRLGTGRLQRVDPPQPQRGPRVRLARRHLSLPAGVPAGDRRLQRGHPARSKLRIRLLPARLRPARAREAGRGLCRLHQVNRTGPQVHHVLPESRHHLLHSHAATTRRRSATSPRRCSLGRTTSTR